MKFFLAFFFAATLYATVNEPLRLEIFSGYRNDRIHWHLQDPGEGGTLTYSELNRDVEYWENGLALKVIHRDLIFFLRGAYGAFGRGQLLQKYPNTPGAPRFRSTTDGWTADVVGYFGYAVNLTADRTYKVLLTPLIGYSGYFEQLKRASGPFKLVWNGFFFGGGFVVEPGGQVSFNVGYSYHLMHNRVRATVRNTLTDQSIKTQSGGNSGQTGWAEIDWLCNPVWRLGIGGQIHYFSTRVVNASISQADRGDFSQKFKLRWTPVSVWAQIARTF